LLTASNSKWGGLGSKCCNGEAASESRVLGGSWVSSSRWGRKGNRGSRSRAYRMSFKWSQARM